MSAMRSAGAYLRNLPRAHLYAWWFVRVCSLFRRPLDFLRHYLGRSSPAVVELRDGTRIRLSGHPHDVITLFVVFAQRTYGRPPAGTVVDIGANLGAFALFAASCGARRVLAYEANSTAYRRLAENVAANRLDGTIRTRHVAVSGEAGRTVRFPVEPSAYNSIAEPGAHGAFEEVGTTSLAEILERDAPEGIDLLKLDCEGAEYEILMAPDAGLDRVREIRMEYHLGRSQELIRHFARTGFEVTLFEPDDHLAGRLWARRSAAA